jgi:hypothetical protein
MASLSCPLCHQLTDMRRYRCPPYRFGYIGIASTIAVYHPNWNQAEGFCQECADIYRGKLQERKRIASDILAAISGLPDLEKRIFVFYHYRGLTVRDIATREHLEEQFVREMLARAARFLYQKLHSRIPVAPRLSNRAGR